MMSTETQIWTPSLMYSIGTPLFDNLDGTYPVELGAG